MGQNLSLISVTGPQDKDMSLKAFPMKILVFFSWSAKAANEDDLVCPCRITSDLLPEEGAVVIC